MQRRWIIGVLLLAVIAFLAACPARNDGSNSSAAGVNGANTGSGDTTGYTPVDNTAGGSASGTDATADPAATADGTATAGDGSTAGATGDGSAQSGPQAEGGDGSATAGSGQNAGDANSSGDSQTDPGVPVNQPASGYWMPLFGRTERGVIEDAAKAEDICEFIVQEGKVYRRKAGQTGLQAMDIGTQIDPKLKFITQGDYLILTDGGTYTMIYAQVQVAPPEAPVLSGTWMAKFDGQDRIPAEVQFNNGMLAIKLAAGLGSFKGKFVHGYFVGRLETMHGMRIAALSAGGQRLAGVTLADPYVEPSFDFGLHQP